MFKRVGDITLTTEANIINRTEGDPPLNWLHPRVDVAEDGPCVYLWVEEPPQSTPVVLYIGKAGSTLALRCRQHSQGFRGADRGKAHAEKLTAIIKRGSKVGIYAMWPEPVPFAGERIPSHSSVEDWLIAVTTPKPEQNR